MFPKIVKENERLKSLDLSPCFPNEESIGIEVQAGGFFGALVQW